MGDVHGQLIHAQAENSAADLTPVSNGLIYFNTATSFIKYYNSAAWKTLADTDSVQTLTNKFTPILRGGTGSFGVMELRGTDHSTDKGFVAVKDGSLLSLSCDADGFTWNTGFLPNEASMNIASSTPSGRPVALVIGHVGTAATDGVDIQMTRATTAFLNGPYINAGDRILTIRGLTYSQNAFQNAGLIRLRAFNTFSSTDHGALWEFHTVTVGTIINQLRVRMDSSALWLCSTGSGAGDPNILWDVDNIGDIGALGTRRPANIYIGNTAYLPTIKLATLIQGGTAANGSIELSSTSHANKGWINIADGSHLSMASSAAGLTFNNDPAATAMLNLATDATTAPFKIAAVLAHAEDIVANPSALQFFRMRGTYSVAAFLQNNDKVFSILGTTTSSSGGPALGNLPVGIIDLRAAEAFSGTATGGRWDFRTVTIGTTSLSTRLSVSSDSIKAVNGTHFSDSAYTQGRVLIPDPAGNGNFVQQAWSDVNTTPTTLADVDRQVFVTTGAGTINITPYIRVGAEVTITKVDAGVGTVVINPNSALSISGNPTYTLTNRYDSVTMVYSASDNIWFVTAARP